MNHLHSAIRKCSYQGHGLHWGGYLQPKETLALRDFGIDIDKYYIDIAIDRKRYGRCGGMWTYFNLDRNSSVEKEFKELKRGLHDQN